MSDSIRWSSSLRWTVFGLVALSFGSTSVAEDASPCSLDTRRSITIREDGPDPPELRVREGHVASIVNRTSRRFEIWLPPSSGLRLIPVPPVGWDFKAPPNQAFQGSPPIEVGGLADFCVPIQGSFRYRIVTRDAEMKAEMSSAGVVTVLSPIETIDTIREMPRVETGIGAECGSQLATITEDVAAKRFDQADRKISAVLSCFRGLMRDTQLRYVCVASSAERERYRSEYRGGKQVVWVDPRYQLALQLKAFMLSARREFALALELLRVQADIAPYAAEPHIERGYIFNVGLGKPREGLAAYRHALALSQEFETSRPAEASALRGIGFALIELGDLDRAESVFRESLEIEPGNSLALNELAYIRRLRQTGR